MSLINDFPLDNQGRRFTDVMGDTRINFSDVLAFFDSEERQKRMVDSEEAHNRPAFAGVVKEFERQPSVKAFFESCDGHTTVRFRQAIGVVVRIVMEQRG